MKGYTGFYFRLLLSALSLGVAWSLRGYFGHEQGAAWAGALGVMMLLVLADREDWNKRLTSITALSAIGFGTGGMMSYGQLVRYVKADDPLNVAFGLFSLFLVGAIYGFIGGGFTGLSLESSPAKKPDWSRLVVEMFVAGFLFWGLLIYQLEWFMTPPRSELWASCLGASAALGWFLYRQGFHKGLKVALFTSLGCGFGFAIGCFLESLTESLSTMPDLWRFMDYSLGFFGGLGMAYAIFSEDWPVSQPPDKAANLLGWLMIILIIPSINIIQNMDQDRLLSRANLHGLLDIAHFISATRKLSLFSLIIFPAVLSWSYRKQLKGIYVWKRQQVLMLFTFLMAWLITLSHLFSAAWMGENIGLQIMYWLYLFLLVIGSLFSSKFRISYPSTHSYQKLWLRLSITVLVVIGLLLLVLLNAHHGQLGAQHRFITE
ncbi:MAG: hypothetical protein ACLFUB_09385 [Cyclobacteriaceae bacterium]